MKPERRRIQACGFLPSVVITGLLLYGGLWLTQRGGVIDLLKWID